jgi:hypothetical protein
MTEFAGTGPIGLGWFSIWFFLALFEIDYQN